MAMASLTTRRPPDKASLAKHGRALCPVRDLADIVSSHGGMKLNPFITMN
jgi:hypothetical protein